MSNRITLGARILLGLIFTIFGLNFFLHFIPVPPAEGAAAAFMGGLFQSGYFLPFMKITEISMGVLLIAGIAPAFALVVLAPIVLNIVLFHLFLAPAGLLVPFLILALEGYLAWHYRAKFAPIFTR
jgi:uncharacterized membrane protein YphA (DoxX/SURF4 family)